MLIKFQILRYELCEKVNDFTALFENSVQHISAAM